MEYKKPVLPVAAFLLPKTRIKVVVLLNAGCSSGGVIKRNITPASIVVSSFGSQMLFVKNTAARSARWPPDVMRL